MKFKKQFVILILVIGFLFISCANQPESTSGEEIRLILGAYTTPREAYSEIIPLFQEYWFQETGQKVVFDESYLGSGAQSRAVINGFEADVVALSLEADVNRIQEAGLITHDWKLEETGGIVTTSIVVIAVREGNPLGVKDWDDLVQPGIEVLTPNPNTSGGAMWNVLAIYGAALRGQVAGIPEDNSVLASEFLSGVLGNVSVMDKAARDSILNFEKGIGDVAITYENEVLVGRQSGQLYESVIPQSTILIENPIAVVDASVDKHGTREVAEAFVQFLFSSDAQEIFAEHGLRVVNDEVAGSFKSEYPDVNDLFTIDYFGGWDVVMGDIFGQDGVYTKAILRVQGGNQ